MPSLAHVRYDDRPIAANFGIGDVVLFASAANDNAPFCNQTFDLDRRVLLSIAPDPGTGARPATKTTYDADGRPYQVDKGTTNAAGSTFTAMETTTTAFDPNGDKTQVSVLDGTAGAAPLSVTQISYDGLGRVICTASRENSAVFGSLPDACTQSAGGVYGPDPITMITYDLAGQELKETRGLGTPLAQAYTTTNYGLDGEKLSILDANGARIHFAYDGFNRLNLITHPDHTTETSVYDPDGDLVIWTNRGGYGVVRCYDVLNRKTSESGITGASLSGACATGGTTNLATRSWDIQPRTFTYDLAGRLTGASVPVNYLLSYAYDAAGRPANRSEISGSVWPVGYGWDNAGNLNSLAYPDGSTVVAYQYDPLNRTTKALIGGQSYGALTYDALGRRQTLTFYDGSTQTWGYDNADRVTSIAHVFPNDTTDNVTFNYAYDPSGRDASRTLDNSAYAYEPSAGSTAYGAVNGLNQYPSVGGYSYTYWPEGGLNQTDALQANYDEMGKLTLAYITNTPGTIDPNNYAFMGLDALGHLYFHGHPTTAGQAYPFTYHSTDGLRPENILEWQCTQTPNVAPTCPTGSTRVYVLGPDPDERWAYIGVNGQIDSPHTDREGTLIALAAGGQAKTLYAYDAYGQNASPASDTVPGPQSYLYRYTGQRLDPNTGLYDYKARDYSPVLGRFYQPDPAGVDQGPNLYEYVGNDPLGAGDPNGKCPISTCGAGGGDLGFDVSINAPLSLQENTSILNSVSKGNASTVLTPIVSSLLDIILGDTHTAQRGNRGKGERGEAGKNPNPEKHGPRKAFGRPGYVVDTDRQGNKGPPRPAKPGEPGYGAVDKLKIEKNTTQLPYTVGDFMEDIRSTIIPPPRSGGTPVPMLPPQIIDP